MEKLTMSMCASRDYLDGYNKAVDDAAAEMKKAMIKAGIDYGILSDAFEDLRAERDRYRNALEKIRQFPMHPNFPEPFHIADAALNP